MTRKLKTLGLALMAVFAFGAVSASAASAQNGVLTSDGPVTLVGDETGELGANSLTAFGQNTRCPASTYTGHGVLTEEDTEKGAEHDYISSGAGSVTITPHYAECTTSSAFGRLGTTVDMNGCDYEFHLGETVAGQTGTYEIKATVICPKDEHIQLTVFTGSHENTPICTSTITEDPAGYDGLHARDTGNNKIDIVGTIEGVVSHRTGGFGCSDATEQNGVLHQDIVVEGRNASGETTEISLSH